MKKKRVQKNNRTAVLFICSFIISGCAAPARFDAAGRQILAVPTVEDDKFSKEETILGPALFINPFGGITRTWRLRSFVDKKTGSARHQLYAEISYIGDWNHFYAAADETAMSLDVGLIDSSVGSCSLGACSLYETVGVALNADALIAHEKTGYEIKLSGKSGAALVITISPEQIDAQLGAVALAKP